MTRLWIYIAYTVAVWILYRTLGGVMRRVRRARRELLRRWTDSIRNKADQRVSIPSRRSV